MEELPIIDISSWTQRPLLDKMDLLSQEQLEIASKWDNLFQKFGFVVLIGHGIDENEFKVLNGEALNFFHDDLIEKMPYNHGYYGHPAGGYTPPGYEAVALSTEAASTSNTTKKSLDPVENFVFTCHPLEYKKPDGESLQPFPSAPKYFERMTDLLKVLHYISACALKIPDLDFFQKHYDSSYPGHELLGKNGNALRITHYPGNSSEILSQSNHGTGEFNSEIRYGAHTDYQGYTILRPDKRDWHTVQDDCSGYRIQYGGLEAKGRDSIDWIKVKIPQEFNALVINAGDLIQHWTNGQWHSPLHRVVNPTSTLLLLEDDTNQKKESNAMVEKSAHDYSRQALVFFTGPLDDCMVEPLAWLSTNESKQSTSLLYPPIRSYDHLLMKLNRTNHS